MNEALTVLQNGLRQVLAGRPRQADWGAPAAMSQSLERVQEAFGSRRAMAKEQRVARGLLAFRIQGEATDFVHLKYACQGLALPMDWESRRLLADRQQVQHLLKGVQYLRRDSRRFLVCYRGLLASLFIGGRDAGRLDGESQENLLLLQVFLRSEYTYLPEDRTLGSLVILEEYPELLSYDPGSLWRQAWGREGESTEPPDVPWAILIRQLAGLPPERPVGKITA